MTKSFRHSSLRADFTQFPWKFCIIGIKLLGQLFLFWDLIFLMKPLKEYLKEKKIFSLFQGKIVAVYDILHQLNITQFLRKSFT